MNPTTPSRSMTDHTMDLTSWLNHLHYLMPPTGMVIIGAGIGSWGKLLGEWEVPVAHFIEADEKQIQRMKATLTDYTDWHLHRALLWRTSAEISFYQASNPAESGILQPETLASLWPNLKTRDEELRQSTTLDSLLHDIQPQMAPNWLIVDCLPALSILQGAGKWLDTSEVIVARVILEDDTVPDEGASKSEIDGFLEVNGFRCIALQEERQPKVVSALYVREYKPQLDQLAQAKAMLEQDKTALATRRDELEKQVAELTHARDEQARLASERQAQLATAEQIKAELIQQTEAIKVQITHLTQAKAQADKQAAELQQRNEQLQMELLEAQRAGIQLTEQLGNAQQQLKEQTAAASEVARELAVQWQAFAHQQDERTATQMMAIQDLRQQLADQAANSALLPTLQEDLSKQNQAQKEQLKEVENHLRNDLTKGLGNAVKQMEAFLGIQNYLRYGDFITDFHGWPISPDIGLFLLETMSEQRYDLIIEFGSGTSTALIAKAAEVLQRTPPPGGAGDCETGLTEIVSFEHDTLYHGKTSQMLKVRGLAERVQLVHAPLTDWRGDGEQGYLYYDCQGTLSALAQKHAHRTLRILVLVDGPPGATCTYARYPAVPIVFSLLSKHHIDVVLDDANRPEEKTVIELWRGFWKKRSVHMTEAMVPSEKGVYFANNQP